VWLIFLLSENLIPIYVIICYAIHAVVKYIVHTKLLYCSRYLSYLCNDGHNRFYRDFSVTIFFLIQSPFICHVFLLFFVKHLCLVCYISAPMCTEKQELWRSAGGVICWLRWKEVNMTNDSVRALLRQTTHSKIYMW
jgi:hypothetical protein